jgi:aminodeoxychorismate lyase
MIVYLNGRFVPEEQACVSIHDRGFLYGDGLFETVRVYDGQPFLWKEHMARLQRGCEIMRIIPPLTGEEMIKVLTELLCRNRLSEATARVALTRGSGPRGYSPRGAEYPTLAIALFPPTKRPANYKLISSAIRLPTHDPFAAFKHGNKLRQVLARAEADDAGADEALLMNDRGEVIEGTSTNIFWIDGQTVCTPALQGILPGTTRGYVLQRCNALAIKAMEATITLPNLLKSEGVFVTSAGLEVMEVSEIDGEPVKKSSITARLKREYRPNK